MHMSSLHPSKRIRSLCYIRSKKKHNEQQLETRVIKCVTVLQYNFIIDEPEHM